MPVLQRRSVDGVAATDEFSGISKEQIRSRRFHLAPVTAMQQQLDRRTRSIRPTFARAGKETRIYGHS